MRSALGVRTLALVPAHDEEAAIAQTVGALRRVEGLDGVVVVADGCSDRTADEALRAGARVLVPPRRLGKGGAIEGALGRVEPAEVYLLVDGDVGLTASQSGVLLAPVLGGELDLCVALLPKLSGGGFGLVRRAAAWLIRAASGFDAQAPLSGQRAVTRRTLDACRPLAGGFGLEAGITIDAARLGFRVGEVPADMRHRATGRGLAGFTHRARQGLHALRAAGPRLLRLR